MKSRSQPCKHLGEGIPDRGDSKEENPEVETREGMPVKLEWGELGEERMKYTERGGEQPFTKMCRHCQGAVVCPIKLETFSIIHPIVLKSDKRVSWRACHIGGLLEILFFNFLKFFFGKKFLYIPYVFGAVPESYLRGCLSKSSVCAPNKTHFSVFRLHILFSQPALVNDLVQPWPFERKSLGSEKRSPLFKVTQGHSWDKSYFPPSPPHSTALSLCFEEQWPPGRRWRRSELRSQASFIMNQLKPSFYDYALGL